MDSSEFQRSMDENVVHALSQGEQAETWLDTDFSGQNIPELKEIVHVQNYIFES